VIGASVPDPKATFKASLANENGGPKNRLKRCFGVPHSDKPSPSEAR